MKKGQRDVWNYFVASMKFVDPGQFYPGTGPVLVLLCTDTGGDRNYEVTAAATSRKVYQGTDRRIEEQTGEGEKKIERTRREKRRDSGFKSVLYSVETRT